MGRSLRGLALSVATALVVLVTGHNLVFLLTYGADYGAALARTGHDSRWTETVQAVLLATSLLAAAAIVRIAYLFGLVQRHRAQGVVYPVRRRRPEPIRPSSSCWRWSSHRPPAPTSSNNSARTASRWAGSTSRPTSGSRTRSRSSSKTRSGKPVNDLQPGDLQVVVSTAGQQTAALPLQPSFDPDTGLGTPGEYTASLIPTQVGDYTFHLSGSIHGQAVDETATIIRPDVQQRHGRHRRPVPGQAPGAGRSSTLIERVDGRPRPPTRPRRRHSKAATQAQQAVAAGAAGGQPGLRQREPRSAGGHPRRRARSTSRAGRPDRRLARLETADVTMRRAFIAWWRRLPLGRSRFRPRAPTRS
jgi:hypothetical protein